VLQNFYQDIHSVAHTEGSSTKVVHDRAEVFDIKTEALFRYLQVRSRRSQPWQLADVRWQPVNAERVARLFLLPLLPMLHPLKLTLLFV
jgi:hypothetical protein